MNGVDAPPIDKDTISNSKQPISLSYGTVDASQKVVVQQTTIPRGLIQQHKDTGKLSDEEVSSIVKEFESRYEMTTTQMKQQVTEGNSPDDFEIMLWQALTE